MDDKKPRRYYEGHKVTPFGIICFMLFLLFIFYCIIVNYGGGQMTGELEEIIILLVGLFILMLIFNGLFWLVGLY